MKRLILLTIVCTLISGCTINEYKARKWAYSHKDKLAEWCADCFPVKPIEVIKGDTVTLLDSIVKIDTNIVQADCPDGTKVNCPPNKVVTKVIKTHSTDTVKVRDTAYERVIEVKLRDITKDNEQLKESLDKMKQSRNAWRFRCFILVLIIGLYIGFKWR